MSSKKSSRRKTDENPRDREGRYASPDPVKRYVTTPLKRLGGRDR